MLPHFANTTEESQLRRIGYTVHEDPETRGLVYSYHVNWTDKTNSSFGKWQWITKQIVHSGKVALTVPVRCDGPCGGMTDADYVEFGLCEHNVCRHCYETARSADHDGIHGCCNADCLELARLDLERRQGEGKKRKKRRSRRLRSEESFRMEYDNEEYRDFYNSMKKASKVSSSTRSEADLKKLSAKSPVCPCRVPEWSNASDKYCRIFFPTSYARNSTSVLHFLPLCLLK